MRIMLELKHSTILKEFLELYEFMLREIKEVKLESLRHEGDRFATIEDIVNKVIGFVQKCPYLFGYFSRYLKDN